MRSRKCSDRISVEVRKLNRVFKVMLEMEGLYSFCRPVRRCKSLSFEFLIRCDITYHFLAIPKLSHFCILFLYSPLTVLRPFLPSPVPFSLGDSTASVVCNLIFSSLPQLSFQRVILTTTCRGGSGFGVSLPQ
jgi:hypothetical protein